MDKNGKIISVVSIKGGSSKSTTCASLAGYLTELQCKTLLIDGDTQPSLSKFFEILKPAENDNGLLELMLSKADPLACVSLTEWENLDIIISNDLDRELIRWLQARNSNLLKLKEKVNQLKKKYDYIIIDSPGNFNKLTETIAIAADIILSPVVPDSISANEVISSTVELFEEITLFRPEGMPEINFLISKKTNTNGAKKYIELIKTLDFTEYDFPMSVLDIEIPSLACYADSADKKTPVHLSDKRAKQHLEQLTQELLPELNSLILERSKNV